MAPLHHRDEKEDGGSLRLTTVLRIRKELHSLALDADSCSSASFGIEDFVPVLQRLGKAEPGNSKQFAETLLRDVRKLPDGKYNVDEWVHHMLRSFCGKETARVLTQLDMILGMALKQQPDVLDELHRAFESALPRRCKGRPGLASIVDIFCRTLWTHCTLGKEDGPWAVDQRRGSRELPLELVAFVQDYKAFARQISETLELGDDVAITHSDFMACFLARQRQEVQLNIYDLSKGRARTLSRWLPIPEMDGLWHSGLVVFGWEYYYCGDVICALPDRTVFGEPSKRLTLGHTMRQRLEFHQFIVQEIKPAFTRVKYDTLHNNCNHFSDRLCGWLGCQRLPVDILQQHVKILEAPFAKVLWPILNNLLGGSNLHNSSRNATSFRCSSIITEGQEDATAAEMEVNVKLDEIGVAHL